MLKTTSAVIASPAPYVSPSAGLLVIETDVTSGVVVLPPSTLWLVASVIAWLPSPSLASMPSPP